MSIKVDEIIGNCFDTQFVIIVPKPDGRQMGFSEGPLVLFQQKDLNEMTLKLV
jgi:hypothetical protein